MSEARETPQTIQQRKGCETIAALTAYDFPMAKLLDAAGVPLIEVTHGDGLGGSSVNYGFPAHSDEEYLGTVIPLMKQANGTRRKLVLFTEFKDTLMDLAAKIRDRLLNRGNN